MTLPVIATPKPSKLSREATLARNVRNWHAVSHVARLFSPSVALGRRGGNGRFPTSRGRPEGEPPVVEGGFAFGERATRDSHARGCGSRAASHDASDGRAERASTRANSSSSSVNRLSLLRGGRATRPASACAVRACGRDDDDDDDDDVPCHRQLSPPTRRRNVACRFPPRKLHPERHSSCDM